jgi:beta-lactamase class A
MMLTRRHLLISAPLLLAGCATAAPSGSRASRRAEEELHALCAGLGRGNRLGVAVIDTDTGRRLRYQADQRFAMASTFKLPLAAAILAEVEAGRMSLAQRIPVVEADLLPNSPVTRAALAEGSVSVERLCAAIVEVSDNSGANLLLRRIGGPAGLTAFLRRSGDPVTRLDRYEMELGTNLAGDPRDTTTPDAMASLLNRLLLGPVLTPASRARLIGWMEGATTGLDRLRAGFPVGWRVGDKTGTALRGANNDIAIAWPPGRPPLIVASYVEAPDRDEARHKATHAAVARIVAATLG